MRTDNSEDTFLTLSPIFIFSQCIGLGSFKVTGSPRSRRLVFKGVYDKITTLLFIFYVVLMIFLTKNAFLYFSTTSSPLFMIGWICNLILELFHFSINIVVSKYYMRKIVSTYNRLYVIEQKINNMNNVLNSRFSYWLFLICIVIDVLMVTSYSIIFAISGFKDSFIPIYEYVIIFCIMTYMILMQCWTDVRFISFFFVLTNLFRKIKLHLITKFFHRSCIRKIWHVKDMNKVNNINILKICCSLIQDISEISRQFNKTITLQILINYTTHFFFTIIQLYAIITSIVNNKFAITNVWNILSICMSVFYVFKLLIVTFVPSLCALQVNIVLILINV